MVKSMNIANNQCIYHFFIGHTQNWFNKNLFLCVSYEREDCIDCITIFHCLVFPVFAFKQLKGAAAKDLRKSTSKFYTGMV